MSDEAGSGAGASVTGDEKLAAVEAKPTVRILRERHAGAILEIRDDFGDLSILIEPAALLQVAETLKSHPELDYCYLMDIAGVDRYREKPRFEVVYNFYSMSKAKRPGRPRRPRIPFTSALTGPASTRSRRYQSTEPKVWKYRTQKVE